MRLLMTAPGVEPITAMSDAAAFDDASRFRTHHFYSADPKRKHAAPSGDRG
jgi:hypothetical protein